MFTDSFDWDVKGAYVMYASSGVFTIVAFIFMHYCAGKVDDRWFNFIGLAMGVIGWMGFIDWEYRAINYVAFFIGYALVTMSFPIGRIITMGMLSKIIGPAKAGSYMGWYLCIGAIARCVGPFWAIQALTISPRLCFGSTAILMFICLILQKVLWKQCEPHPEFMQGKELKEN